MVVARLGIVFWLLGCGDPIDPDREYIAMQADFEDYDRWHRYDYVGDFRLGETPRTVYISDRPSRGDTAFAVGTRIVKVAESEEDPTTWLMVAMAKRGHGYNADGAVGWEWFDLDLSPSGTPLVDWRGPVPPEGSGYECALGEDEPGGENVGDCNTCHRAAADNDYVLAPVLSLR